MEKLIEQIRLKADACGDATKEQRARKGAYVDCLVMMKEALHKLSVSSKRPSDEYTLGYKTGWSDCCKDAKENP